MKARPISPYRAEIRQLEERIEELRRLDAEWRTNRNDTIRSERATHSLGQLARRYNLSVTHIFSVTGSTGTGVFSFTGNRKVSVTPP